MDIKWNLVIEGRVNEVTVNIIGNTTNETRLEILRRNLEGPCGIPDSQAFAVNILSNIEKLTSKFFDKIGYSTTLTTGNLEVSACRLEQF